MNYKFLAVITVGLWTAPVVAQADLVQSSTSVNLTFRDCIPGGTSACDSVSSAINTYAGFPGDQTAQVDVDDPAYGTTSGSAELAGETAGIMSAESTSLAGKRNGSNSGTLRRYTNMGLIPETLTFDATLTYEQTVPLANADFLVKSQAVVELLIYSTSDDSIEAGTDELSNYQAVWFLNSCASCTNPFPSNFNFLTSDYFESSSNVSGAGTMTRTLSAVVGPGESIWLGAWLQSLAANGAVVDATLNTNISSNIYSCIGFESPADEDLVVKKQNRVLPLRMSLLDIDGMDVSDIAPPVVGVSYTAVGGNPAEFTDELTYAGKGDDGNQFLFNGSQWAFNLKTKGLAAGTYTLTAVPGDPSYVINPTCEATVIIQ